MKMKILSKSIFLMTAILFLSFSKNSFGNEKGSMKGSPMEHKGSSMEYKGSMTEHKGSGSEMSQEQEAMMAKWQEYATPGKAHTILNALVGNWSYTIKHWMSADATANASTGSSESAWIMDGRFVEEKVSGTSMGQPFSGRSIMGYNNGTKMYSSYWFDSMSTGAMFSEGIFDSEAKTISSEGNFFCPFRGVTAYRSVLTITDENSHSYEMYVTEVDGNEFLTMQLNYTRK